MSVTPSTPPFPNANQRNSQAIASVVLAVLAFVIMFFIDCLPFVSALLAIYAGVRGLIAAKRLAGRGKYMALTGIGLGGLAILLALVQSFFIYQQARRPLQDQIARATAAAQPTPGLLTFTQNDITVQYPTTWDAYDTSQLDDPTCQQKNVTCMFVLGHSADKGATINVVQLAMPKAMTVVKADEDIWTLMTANTPAIELLTYETLEVNGWPAVKRVFTQPAETQQAGPNYFFQIYIADDLRLYQITGAMYGDEAYAAYAAEVETIATSFSINK